MKIITGFEEGFSTAENPPHPASKDYDQILEAAKHSLSTAETVFARGAKKDLKEALTKRLGTGFSMKKASEGLELRPFWVVEISVAVNLYEQEFLGVILSSMVQKLADTIVSEVKEKHLVLVDPVQVRLLQIGDKVYQFRLKQKWSVTNSPPEKS